MHGTGHGIGAFLSIHEGINTAQKMKLFMKYIFSKSLHKKFGYIHGTKHEGFSIKDFFTECDQIRRKLRIWSHSLKKSLIENFILPPSYNWAQKSSEIN